MRIRAVLFDLDDTLVHDRAGYRDAAAGAWRSVIGSEADPDLLIAALRQASRKFWDESPAREYCLGVGLFPLAGLVSQFPGDGHALNLLRAWAPGYRLDVWRKVLSKMGASKALAPGIAIEFTGRTLIGARPLDGAVAAVEALGGAYRLALITNGAADLQTAKLQASGLAPHFASRSISTQVGYGKPDARIFQHAIDALGVNASETVIVGDNRINDIVGGIDAGLRAVWLQPDREKWPEAPEGAAIIDSLHGLAAVIAGLEG